MRSNREIRQVAWARLRTKWFWRLLVVGTILQLVTQTVGHLLSVSFREMSVQTWNDFFFAKAQAAQAGLSYAVPSRLVAGQMTGATAFQTFITCIFGAILAFGLATVTLKAVRDDEHRWFADSFGGFSRPLEVTWLLVLMNLRVFLWSLLLIVPGLVALYRYRLAWYLKTDHPDWGAGQCLAESGRRMNGCKWRACALDCSFVGWFFLVGLAMSIAVLLGAVGEGSVLMSALAFGVGLAAVSLLFFVLCYFVMARTVFYRELAAGVSHLKSKDTPVTPY